MKLLLHKVLVFTAFSVLMVHNFTPHHHHHGETITFDHVSHEHENEHHGHSPFAHLNLDDSFLAKSINYKAFQGVVALVPLHIFIDLDFTPQSPGYTQNPTDKIPLPPLLACNPLRGPPQV